MFIFFHVDEVIYNFNFLLVAQVYIIQFCLFFCQETFQASLCHADDSYSGHIALNQALVAWVVEWATNTTSSG